MTSELTCEACQVVHLVLEPTVLVLGEVGEAAAGDLDELFFHVQRRLVEETLRLQRKRAQKHEHIYRGGNKGLYVVAINFFLLLLNCSAWPCLGPA